MPNSPPLNEAAQATRSFLSSLASHRPERVEAKVASAAGMPLLCAVEAALAEALPAKTTQELMWLAGAPEGGVHRLWLLAYGAGNELLAKSAHEFGR
jgi:hypothetical protein